ncbi:MAG: DinB family protein [Bacillaceae bacterium]|nr:DinB family protein [Bacillaceae bacterium]
MNAKGFLYAAQMTNALAREIPESRWDESLMDELGTLRKLFVHIIRVRDVYRDGMKSGKVVFPGNLPAQERDLFDELERSMADLAREFERSHWDQQILMGAGQMTALELLNTAVQHEGIHQGQYFVALKQAGIHLPELWRRDWNM